MTYAIVAMTIPGMANFSREFRELLEQYSRKKASALYQSGDDSFKLQVYNKLRATYEININ